MNLFLVGLVMAAVTLFTSCRNQKEKKLDDILRQIDELGEEIKSVPVPDDGSRINYVLYQISDVHKVFGAHGSETKDLDFGGNGFDYYRLLLPKELGGFEVGYLVKTVLGVTLQSNKTFYFYNKLGLTSDIVEIYSVAGMILSDGTLIPVKITVKGKDNPIMWECKDTDVLTFEPLVYNTDIKELSFSVKELKEYCTKNGLKYRYFTPYIASTKTIKVQTLISIPKNTINAFLSHNLP